MSVTYRHAFDHVALVLQGHKKIADPVTCPIEDNPHIYYPIWQVDLHRPINSPVVGNGNVIRYTIPRLIASVERAVFRSDGNLFDRCHKRIRSRVFLQRSLTLHRFTVRLENRRALPGIGLRKVRSDPVYKRPSSDRCIHCVVAGNPELDVISMVIESVGVLPIELLQHPDWITKPPSSINRIDRWDT